MADTAAAEAAKTGQEAPSEKPAEKKGASETGATADKAKPDGGEGAKAPARSEKTFSKAELEAEKKKAVEEAQKKWNEDKDLSDLERIKKENEELKEAARMRDAKDDVLGALTAAGSRSPEMAWSAIRGDLKFDNGGKLLNTKDLIEGLKEKYPEQFGVDKPTEGIGGGAGTGQKAGSKLTPEEIAKMSPAEINKNWSEVSKALAEK